VKTLRIGLLGFGTVGKSLVRLMDRGAEARRDRKGIDLRIVAIGNRRVSEKKEAWVAEGIRWTEDLESVVLDPGVDAIVELLGGPEPAGRLVHAAIGAGKHVVTANKLLLAREGEELARSAAGRGVALGIEASVAGGIPILRALRESFAEPPPKVQ